MSSKTIAYAMNKMNVADLELAARCRARIKAIKKHIRKLDAELVEVKQKDNLLWDKFVFADYTLFDLPRDEREVLWERSEKHKKFQSLMISYNNEIVYFQQQIERIRELAKELLVDLTIED